MANWTAPGRWSHDYLRSAIGEDIELVMVLHPAIGHIKADPGQISQILMNLAVNARDAMPQGGKLLIETASVHLDQEYVRHHLGAKPGSYIMLALVDTGTGQCRDRTNSEYILGLELRHRQH